MIHNVVQTQQQQLSQGLQEVEEEGRDVCEGLMRN